MNAKLLINSGEPASLKLSVDGDYALSDGTGDINVSCTVSDKNGSPVSGVSIVFQLESGSSSVFKENNSLILKANTDSNGVVDVNVTNSSEETLTDIVTVFILDNKKITDCVNVHFKTRTDQLVVDSVYNANITLKDGQPSAAWVGAEFFIKTSGGSGDVTWSEKDSSTSALSLQQNDNVLTVRIIAVFLGEKKLQCKDNVTGEIITYSFSLADFFVFLNVDMSYDVVMSSKLIDQLPSAETFLSSYRQWGDMSKYEEWKDKGYEFWVSYYDETASAFNIVTGTIAELLFTDVRPVVLDINFN